MSDKDRWKKLLSVQPKLIGMKFDEVEKALGHGKAQGAKSILHYQVIQYKEPSKPGTLATIELTINFQKGAVKSYTVEAVYWGK